MTPGATYKISYAFAKANGVVVTSVGTDLAEVAVRTDAPPGAIIELRRVLGVPVQARRVGIDEFDELVSTQYNGAEEGAAALAGDLAQDLDLSRLLQEIPKIADLLEINHTAVHMRLSRARQRLAERLKLQGVVGLPH